MESSRDDKLAATLSALRPAPRPAFAAELDERAAAGFPPQTRATRSPVARAIARLRGLSPQRVLLPAVGVALIALAITSALVAISHTGSGVSSDSSVASAVSSPASEGAAPTQMAPNSSSSSAGAAGGTGATPSVESEVAGPEVEIPTSAAEAADSEGGTFDRSGRYASGAPHRDVERSAEMVLGADPTEVSDDAAKVFAAVHSTGGIVLNSSVHDGSGESAPGANFELLIPSAKLGDALGAFSQIAEVRYRREATNDITAPTVGVSERLQDSNAKVESLLAQLAAAESDGEREAVEAELATERRHAASLRSRLTALQRRANFSRVLLRIKTGESSAPSASGGGGWSIGDALHDAGHILAIAAGVAIVGLAILGPLALIALLIWLANRAWVQRSRQRALG
jgi:hypothetical protein